MALIPRKYQTDAVDSLFDYFANHKEGNPVVALPTGTGKALSICLFLQRAFKMYAQQKVLVVTHVKELIDQNYKEFLNLWPQAPAGIYSAGLKRKDTNNRIIFCGIASINKNLSAFGKVDLVIIDECHLLSQNDESMYLRVITTLKEVNPFLKVIGFTATPWRAGQGKITDDGIFTDICFDLTHMVEFNRFIKDGYLAPLVPKATRTILDVSGVHMRGGEFIESELQLAVDKDEITYAAIQESILHGFDRNHWLVFGAGIKHVLKITEMLNHLGVSARCVHSKMPDAERDSNVQDWKDGRFKAIVNNGILTTGVNFKAIDLIVMLRPTHSTVLWIQMLGRGTRPSPETNKENCLVLDFAGNTKRLGPINDPVIPRKRGEKTGEVPIKLCDSCDMYNHISARFCGGEPFKTTEGCGSEFVFKTLLKKGASSEELIKNEEPIVTTVAVEQITFVVHKKQNKPDSLKVTYWCGLQKYNEFVLFEHVGFGKRKAQHWWSLRAAPDLEFPANTFEASRVVDKLKTPSHIKVWVNKPFPEILNVAFNGTFV